VRAPREPAVVAEEPLPPEPEGACRYSMVPLRGGSSVLTAETIAKLYDNAATGLTPAVCRCARASWPSAINLRVTVRPDRGSVAVGGIEHVGRTEERDARCLARVAEAQSFEPWHLGSDCIGCAGWRMGSWPSLATSSDPEPPTPVEEESSVTLFVTFTR
jgi:hypothetical protein